MCARTIRRLGRRGRMPTTSGGNIRSKTEYAYTTGTLGAAVRTVTYGYGDAGWSDLLTSIGGQSLTADEIGNLLSDGTWAYTWQHGRQLAGMSKAGPDNRLPLRCRRPAHHQNRQRHGVQLPSIWATS